MAAHFTPGPKDQSTFGESMVKLDIGVHVDGYIAERLGQAGWLSPSKAGAKVSGAEAGFTSSSGDVRASSVNAKKELSGQERLEAVPSRFK
jgi:hypothetical protein